MENIITPEGPETMPYELLKAADVTRKLKEGEPGKFADGKGLYLQIAGPGRASWTVQYRLNRQTKWTSIGSAFDYCLLYTSDAADE